MGLPLPGEFAGLATAVGLVWPEADEDALHAAAARWTAVAETLRAGSAEAATEVGRLLDAHPDGDLDGFGARWAAGPALQYEDAVLAAEALAGCLTTMAAVVLELKVFAVGRLAALAARLAAPAGSPATGSPPAGSPAAGSPIGESLTAGSPAAGSPAAGSPIGESLAAGSPIGGSLAAELVDLAAATAATRAALRRATADATAVVDGSLAPVLRTAEQRLHAALARP